MSATVLSTSRPRLAPRVRLEWDPVRERRVLLAPEGVLVMNETGADILKMCDGERTVADILRELRGQYEGVDEDEVRGFLTRLAARRWLEIGDD